MVFLGDSVVEGASVENNETMDSIFEEITGVTTLNFGVSSRGTYLEYEYLKAKLKPEYNTRLVILGYCVNDFEEARMVRGFDERYGNWFWLRFLNEGMDLGQGILYKLTTNTLLEDQTKSAVQGFMETAIAKKFYNPSWSPKPAKDDELWGSWRISDDMKMFTAYHLRLIKEYVESMDAQLLVALFPARSQIGLEHRPGNRLQDPLIKILQNNDIAFVDLQDGVNDAVAQQPDLRWYHDEVHPYKAGHRLFGTLLAGHAKKSFPDLF